MRFTRGKRFGRKYGREQAQTAVVGTILAIMVLLAFLGLFTGQYIPTAMSDMEAEHMKEVEQQIAALRQTIDNQILTRNMDMALYSPIRLGTDHVPAFSAPTAGELIFAPEDGEVRTTFHDSGQAINESGSGTLTFYAPNRYYTPQTIVYQATAIVKSQSRGETMSSAPHIIFSTVNGSLTATITLVNMVGSPADIVGTQTVGVNTRLAFYDTFTYSNLSTSLNITLHTAYWKAWLQFFNDTFHDNDITYGNGWNYTVSATTGDEYVLNVSVDHVEVVKLNIAVIDIKVGSGTITTT